MGRFDFVLVNACDAEEPFTKLSLERGLLSLLAVITTTQLLPTIHYGPSHIERRLEGVSLSC